MQHFKSFSDKLSTLDPSRFEELALELFQFQATENEVYRSYLEARKVEVRQVRSLETIPFLPIRFFKDFPVVSGKASDFASFYSSSGTTGMITSKHYIWSESWYLRHAQ